MPSLGRAEQGGSSCSQNGVHPSGHLSSVQKELPTPEGQDNADCFVQGPRQAQHFRILLDSESQAEAGVTKCRLGRPDLSRNVPERPSLRNPRHRRASFQKPHRWDGDRDTCLRVK